MNQISDEELADLKRKATQERSRRGWHYGLLGRSDLDSGYWIAELVTEIQRLRQRCAQLEGDYAQLQREYDVLRYGTSPPAH
jgi:hypothetical protein